MRRLRRCGDCDVPIVVNSEIYALQDKTGVAFCLDCADNHGDVSLSDPNAVVEL